MTTPTRQDLELYIMGAYDGDPADLEQALASDPAARAILAEEAGFELLLRDAAAAATFCPACQDLVPDSNALARPGSARCDACGAAVRPGGYVVERVLVSNAHGRMYVAHDADGTQVALKELAFVQSPTLEVIAAFEREAKFLRALEHPAIPRFCASFEEGTGVHVRYYLAQELVTGEPLDTRLLDHWFTEREVIDLAREVLRVLVYLQGLSPMVIHRDIKPANLIARADGSIAVVDFGAAHVQGTTAGSTSIGTFGYMPIEQLAGEVDATTDPYALGASLLHLLSRCEPWRILQAGARLESINVSAPLRGFLGKLVAPEPRDRFRSASLALEALERVARGEHVVPVARRRATPWSHPVMIVSSIVAVLGAGAFVLSFLRAGDSQPEVPQPATPIGTAIGTLRVDLAPGSEADLFVDGAVITHVTSHADIAVAVGRRRIELRGTAGQHCEQIIEVAPGKTVSVVCVLTASHNVDPFAPVIAGTDEHLPPGKLVSFTYAKAQLHDVLRQLVQQCGVNLVIPDTIGAKVDVQLDKVPCDQALEVLLESRGLWYAYRKDGNLLRVATRRDLDNAAENTRERARAGVHDDVLPGGGTVDLDFKSVLLHDVLQMLAKSGGVNIVLPETIAAGTVTVRMKDVPWNVALETILDAHGLWYRYRVNGKVVRIATRRELDNEAEDARNRDHR